MKKNYIQPESSIVRFNMEGMIAESLEVNTSSTSTVSGASIFSNEKGWDDDDWIDEEE